MKKSRGVILIVALFAISIMIAVGAVILKITSAENTIVKMELDRNTAFYLAEAGLERAKIILDSNPDWFTDVHHSSTDDIAWLTDIADGYCEELGDGTFKIIKESNKNALYSIGYLKTFGKRTAVSIIKMEYQREPFKQLKWQIL